MKTRKVILFSLFILVFCASQIVFTQFDFFLNSQSKGYWSRTETKLVLKDRNDPPYFITKKGVEGQLQTICRFEEKNKKEFAITNWFWNPPPKVLIAGNSWKEKMSGSIEKWETSELFASTMVMRIQSFGASCCDITGIDLGYLHLDGYEEDKENIPEESVKKVMIPQFGDLSSQKTKKIQILTNISLNGANYQWFSIYEWNDQPSIYLIFRINSDSAKINQEKVTLQAKPMLISGTSYIPIRPFGDIFGCLLDIKNNEKTGLIKEIIMEMEDTRLIFNIDSNQCYKNGALLDEKIPLKMISGRLFIPARSLASLLNLSVSWNQQKKEISFLKTW